MEEHDVALGVVKNQVDGVKADHRLQALREITEKPGKVAVRDNRFQDGKQRMVLPQQAIRGRLNDGTHEIAIRWTGHFLSIYGSPAEFVQQPVGGAPNECGAAATNERQVEFCSSRKFSVDA
jgi:hypothetical protein